jgi:mono/diheme cytochrome c family protein
MKTLANKFASVAHPARRTLVIATCAVALIAGCRKQDMAEQYKYLPETPSAMFTDGISSRPLVDGAIPRGMSRIDTHRFFGTVNDQPATTFPDDFPTQGQALRQALVRGQERFTIYCSMCHGQTGDANGIVVMRGFTQPPSFHIDRLRAAPVGYIFDVISNGHGAMYGYGDRVSVDDRWNIIAYLRVLQYSRAVKPADLGDEDLAALKNIAQ